MIHAYCTALTVDTFYQFVITAMLISALITTNQGQDQNRTAVPKCIHRERKEMSGRKVKIVSHDEKLSSNARWGKKKRPISLGINMVLIVSLPNRCCANFWVC